MSEKMREILKCLLALHDNQVDVAHVWDKTMEEARAALAEQPAQGEAVAWRDFPEQVPDPDTECLVEVAFNGGRYRAVDTWEMQSEAPLEWSSATVQTGYDWSSYPGDVQRWIPIGSITAPPAPSVPDGCKQLIVSVVSNIGETCEGISEEGAVRSISEELDRLAAKLDAAPEVSRG